MKKAPTFKPVTRKSLNDRRRKAFRAVNCSLSEEINQPVNRLVMEDLWSSFDEIVYNLRTDFHKSCEKQQFIAEFRSFMEKIHSNIY